LGFRVQDLGSRVQGKPGSGEVVSAREEWTPVTGGAWIEARRRRAGALVGMPPSDDSAHVGAIGLALEPLAWCLRVRTAGARGRSGASVFAGVLTRLGASGCVLYGLKKAGMLGAEAASGAVVRSQSRGGPVISFLSACVYGWTKAGTLGAGASSARL